MNKVHEVITDRLIEKLEKLPDNATWQQTWSSTNPINAISGKEYQGINVMMLGLSDFESDTWITMNQVKKAGGRIKKEELKNSEMVTFFTPYTKKDSDPEVEDKTWYVTKYTRVWNVAQCTGLDKITAKAKQLKDNEVIPTAEEVVENWEHRPTIVSGKPSYVPSTDIVNIPNIKQFDTSDDYYKVLFHELVHSTGHKSRLDRELCTKSMRSDSYAKEELIAELGATFLANYVNLAESDNNVTYIKSWLKRFKDDKSLLIQASKKANQATNHILNKAQRA